MKTPGAIIFSFSLCAFGLSASMVSNEKSDFCIADSIRAAWAEVSEYMQRASSGRVTDEPDPQQAYAQRFYDFYLKNPGSAERDDALVAAFMMWHNLGDLESMQEAMREIGYDSPVWAKLLLPVQNVYAKEKRYGEFIGMAQELEDKLKDERSQSELFHLIALHYHYRADDAEKAKTYHSRIVALDADSFMVERAKGYIYEIDSLNVGQRAPDFTAKDIGGTERSLSRYRGKYVLLDFWAMWCSPCVRDIPSLVDAYSKFPRGKLEIVGISKDRDAETVRSFMEENNVTWPNILDEQKRKGSIAATYNIYMLPTSYFIGPDGTIISKWHCQENLTQKLKELIDSWDAKSSR